MVSVDEFGINSVFSFITDLDILELFEFFPLSSFALFDDGLPRGRINLSECPLYDGVST